MNWVDGILKSISRILSEAVVLLVKMYLFNSKFTCAQMIYARCRISTKDGY